VAVVRHRKRLRAFYLYSQQLNAVVNSKLVYSTDKGRVCPKCGWPIDNCQCSSVRARANEFVPDRVVAKLRMEKKGRGGKTVTVVYGLPQNSAFLKELTQELKRLCGTGGSTTEDGVELQGDLRDRVREALLKKGYVVKGG
jgi:translation initiation factor 1